MTSRLLPPEDWDRLDATEAGVCWRDLDPARTRVLVTERDGAITGCVVLMLAVHAEFLWVAEPYRARTSVLRRLRQILLAEARAWRAPTVLMAAFSRQMNGILCGLGAVRLPGDHYVLTMKEVA